MKRREFLQTGAAGTLAAGALGASTALAATPYNDQILVYIFLRGGIDGIAMGKEWLYYGAISGSGLYRVRLRDLRDEKLPAAQLARRVERVSDKPLSDNSCLVAPKWPLHPPRRC